MLNSDETNTKPDPNEFEISPVPTAEERELVRLMLEYTRHHPPQRAVKK